MVKNTIIFVTGAIFGGVAGYFVTKSLLDNKHDLQLKSEREELRAFYQNKQIEMCKGCGITKEVIISDGECKQRRPKEESNGISEDDYFTKSNRGKKTEYSSFFRPSSPSYDTKLTNDILDPGGPTDDDPDDPENLEEIDHADDIIVEQLKRGIELISNVDYTERNGYDKEELFYYKKNDILADSDDEIVESSFDMVGSEFLDVIEQAGSKVIYVRNNNFAKDFLITVLNERYEGDII